MAYIRRDYYANLYGDIPEADFNRLSWDACRVLDNYTTGADGYKKLKHAFPTEEDDAEAVKRCACRLVYFMQQIEAAENSASMARGYTETAAGLQRRIVSRVESGSEAISYAESQGSQTIVDTAVSDKTARESLFAATVREHLSGVMDANGVCLLYMGVYPHV